METVQINWDNKEHKLNVVLAGRLDAATAPDVEKKVLSFLEGREKAACIVDVEKLGYAPTLYMDLSVEKLKDLQW